MAEHLRVVGRSDGDEGGAGRDSIPVPLGGDRRPRRIALLYGEIDGDGLVFVSMAKAYQLIGLGLALATAHTWGDLRMLVLDDVYRQIVAMVRDTRGREEDWEPAADVAFNTNDLSAYHDGDWPDWPAQEALSWLPIEIQERYGTDEESVLNGPYLHLDPEHEAAIVRDLELAGYRCQRDQRLLEQALGYQDPAVPWTWNWADEAAADRDAAEDEEGHAPGHGS